MSDPAPSGMRELIVCLSDEPEWSRRTAGLVTDGILAELPGLVDDPDSLNALRESVAANVRLMVEMIRTGVAASEARPPPAAAEYAREFVRRGLPVDSLLRAYFVGHASFFAYLRGELPKRINEPDARALTLDELTSWSFTFIQALTRGIVERYSDERERWVRSSAALKGDLVDAILSGRERDAAAASAPLHYRLDRNHLAFVVWSEASGAPHDPGACERAAAEFAAELGSDDALLLPRGAGLVAGWVGFRGSSLAIDLGEIEPPGLGGEDRIRLAIGSQALGVDGFRVSHDQAMEARRVAILSGAEAEAISSYRELALSALASHDLERAAAFCHQELGSLLADDERSRRLRKTALSYLESGSSPRQTAARLGVHENTVANHIHAAEETLAHPLSERPGELLVALRLAPLVLGDEARGSSGAR